MIVAHEGKSWLASKGLAKRVKLKHDKQDCRRCRSGLYRWDLYACFFGGVKHHHVGHRHINAWAWGEN